jgi:hypothetical protein
MSNSIIGDENCYGNKIASIWPIIDQYPNDGGFNLMLTSKEFLEHIIPYTVVMHEECSQEGDILIIRFQNGFGVKILRLALEAKNPSFFVVMVLKFHGSRIKDYKLAQYSCIPEVNWLDGHEEITELCQKVSCLPPNRKE